MHGRPRQQGLPGSAHDGWHARIWQGPPAETGAGPARLRRPARQPRTPAAAAAAGCCGAAGGGSRDGSCGVARAAVSSCGLCGAELAQCEDRALRRGDSCCQPLKFLSSDFKTRRDYICAERAISNAVAAMAMEDTVAVTVISPSANEESNTDNEKLQPRRQSHHGTATHGRRVQVALRRSIPAKNAYVRDVQTRLEGIQFKLRIPQRKPWGAISDDAAAAAATMDASQNVPPPPPRPQNLQICQLELAVTCKATHPATVPPRTSSVCIIAATWINLGGGRRLQPRLSFLWGDGGAVDAGADRP